MTRSTIIPAPLVALPSLLVLVGAGLVGCSSVRYRESFVPDGDVRHIVVHSDAGLVELVAGEALRVQRDIRAPELALDLSHRVEDGVLYLDARCEPLLPCAVDTRVEVPAGVTVAVDLGQGEIWATGIDGLELEVDEGLVDLDLDGQLSASLGQGTVRARLGEGARAHVGVGRGDILVQVPSGAWDIEAVTPSFDSSEVGIVSGVASSLDLVAPAGRIQVQGVADLARR